MTPLQAEAVEHAEKDPDAMRLFVAGFLCGGATQLGSRRGGPLVDPVGVTPDDDEISGFTIDLASGIRLHVSVDVAGEREPAA